MFPYIYISLFPLLSHPIERYITAYTRNKNSAKSKKGHVPIRNRKDENKGKLHILRTFFPQQKPKIHE